MPSPASDFGAAVATAPDLPAGPGDAVRPTAASDSRQREELEPSDDRHGRRRKLDPNAIGALVHVIDRNRPPPFSKRCLRARSRRSPRDRPQDAGGRRSPLLCWSSRTTWSA